MLILLSLAFVIYLAWDSFRTDLAIRDTTFVQTAKGVAVTGTLVNPTKRPVPFLTIEVRFFNAAHEKVGEALARVDGIPPRGSVSFATKEVALPNAVHYQVTMPALLNPYGN